MLIGRIVSSRSHVDYVCQVYSSLEVPEIPPPEAYGFGTFVGIERDDDGSLVGLVYDTTLLNPEFGNLGPRLSAQEDLAVFSPDYLAEKTTVVAVCVIGSVDGSGVARQGVPQAAAAIDARVRGLDREQIVAFHRPRSSLKVAYLPMLAAMRHPLASSLTLETIRALRELFPEDARRLAVLHANVAWRARIEPVG